MTGVSTAAAQNGDRVIRKLDFEGNKAIADELLATAIATTNSSWFARTFLFRWLGLGEKRTFDEQEFRRDVVRLDVFYRRSGYPHVQIDTIVRRTPQNVYITFNIKEGEPTRVTDLTVTGIDTLPEKIRDEMLVDLPLRQGDPFNRYVMQVTADTITRRLRDRGYPTARIFSSFETNKDANTAKVAMDVEPGRTAVIGTVTVDGTTRIDPNLVRKLLVSRPGPPLLAGRAVSESTQSLQLGPIPVRYGECRFGCVPTGSGFGSHSGSGKRGQAAPDSERDRVWNG